MQHNVLKWHDANMIHKCANSPIALRTSPSCLKSPTIKCRITCRTVNDKQASRRPADEGGAVSPGSLAYLGDAVWSLYVRRHFFTPPKHVSTYHKLVKHEVTAEQQALFLGHLLASGELTDTELDVIASSRKSRGGTVRKRFSTQEEVEVYNKATALEVLVGFLALRDKERLKRVFQCWEEWICQQG